MYSRILYNNNRHLHPHHHQTITTTTTIIIVINMTSPSSPYARHRHPQQHSTKNRYTQCTCVYCYWHFLRQGIRPLIASCNVLYSNFGRFRLLKWILSTVYIHANNLEWIYGSEEYAPVSLPKRSVTCTNQSINNVSRNCVRSHVEGRGNLSFQLLISSIRSCVSQRRLACELQRYFDFYYDVRSQTHFQAERLFVTFFFDEPRIKKLTEWEGKWSIRTDAIVDNQAADFRFNFVRHRISPNKFACNNQSSVVHFHWFRLFHCYLSNTFGLHDDIVSTALLRSRHKNIHSCAGDFIAVVMIVVCSSYVLVCFC